MWTTKRNDLTAVLDIIAMIPEKLGLPSSEYIWIRGRGSKITMSVASYMSAEVKLEGKGDWPFKESFFLDRRSFVPWVRSAREHKDKHLFEFHKNENQLILRHGSRKVEFDNQKKIHGYGNLARIKKEAISTIPISKELRSLLNCGSNCAVSDTIQPHLNCVYTMGKGKFVVSYAASDYVFFIGQGASDGEIKEKIPFPLFLINLLADEGIKKITYAEKYILLHFKHGIVWQPISEEAIKKFPLKRIGKYSKASQDYPRAFTVSSRRFSNTALRLSYYLQSERRRDWVIIIKGNRGDDKIYMNSLLPGINFREKLDVSDKVKKSFKVEWPLGWLVRVFDFLSKNTKKVPLELRVDNHNAHSYVRAGSYWLAIPSKQV